MNFALGRAAEDVVVLFVRQQLDLVGAGFNGGRLPINVRSPGDAASTRPTFSKTGLLAPEANQLAHAEPRADFRRGANHVVRVNLDDDRHVVRPPRPS